MCMCVFSCPWRAEEDTEFPGAGVIGSCKPLGMGPLKRAVDAFNYLSSC